MSIVLESSENECVIRAEGEIEITSAAELKRMLLAALEYRKQVQLDLERATDLDVTAVQLFWAAARKAEAGGTALVVVHVTETIDRAMREMGLGKFPAAVTAAAAPQDSKSSATKKHG